MGFLNIGPRVFLLESLLVVADYQLPSDGGDGHTRPDFDWVDVGRQFRVDDHPLKLALDGKLDALVAAESEARNFLEKK